jgi:hypothetical protein
MSQNLLAQSHLFTRATYDFTLTKDQRQEVTHERAKAIALSFSKPFFRRNFRHAHRSDLTVEDILTCSEKFWNATLHPINVIDGAAAALWTIHVNLACGTLTQYAGSRPEIRELCRQILAFEMTYEISSRPILQLMLNLLLEHIICSLRSATDSIPRTSRPPPNYFPMEILKYTPRIAEPRSEFWWP